MAGDCGGGGGGDGDFSSWVGASAMAVTDGMMVGQGGVGWWSHMPSDNGGVGERGSYLPT